MLSNYNWAKKNIISDNERRKQYYETNKVTENMRQKCKTKKKKKKNIPAARMDCSTNSGIGFAWDFKKVRTRRNTKFVYFYMWALWLPIEKYVMYIIWLINNQSSGWPSGLRRQTQVLVFERGRGFKSHFWQLFL